MLVNLWRNISWTDKLRVYVEINKDSYGYVERV